MTGSINKSNSALRLPRRIHPNCPNALAAQSMTRRSLGGEGHASGTNDARTRANPFDIGICLIGIGRSQLAWRFASPSLECMSECAHLMKAEQPRNLRYMHLA